MRILKTILATSLVASLSACGMMSHHIAMGNPDKMFVMDAAMASNAELATSQLALQRSKNADVREFATMMVSDHTGANKKLEPIAMKQGLTLPTSPDPTHVVMNDHLAKVPDDKFDSEYAAQMLADHEMVVNKFEHVSKNAMDPAIRNYASMQLPVLKHHLEIVEALEKKLSK